jgi:hypothetical protein
MRGIELPGVGLRIFMTRLNRNSSLEWLNQRDSPRHTLLVSLVACAVGATASAAVILGLVDFATTQPGVTSISARAIVQDASAFQDTTAAQSRPMVETPRGPAPTVASASNEPVTQKEEEHLSEMHSQQSRNHSRVVIHSREPHWRRQFTRTFSRSQRISLW